MNSSARFIDGSLDLFLGAADSWDNQPHDLLLLNDGHGYFTLAPDNALPTRYGGRDWGTVSSQVVDLDGDGWPDVINTVNAPNYSEGAIQILLNNHDGTFRDATALMLQPAWQRNGSLYSDPGGVVYVDPVFPAGAVSAIVPFGVAPQSRANVVVEYQGNQSIPVSIFVASSAPGLFTSDSSGAGLAAILNVDSVSGAVSVNGPQNPASQGGIIVAYITGAGQTNPPSTDGAIAGSAGMLALPVEAWLNFFPSSGIGSTLCETDPNCTPVQVLYAGPAPGIVAGVTQINMRLPDSPSVSGTRSLGISVGGIWSQFSATVSVR